jgi:hypothetical protein
MGEWRRSGYGPSLRTDEFRESGKPVSELDAARQWRAHGSEVVVSQLRDNDQNVWGLPLHPQAHETLYQGAQPLVSNAATDAGIWA